MISPERGPSPNQSHQPDKPVIPPLNRQLAKGIGAFSEETLASGGDNGNSAALGFEKEYRLCGQIATTRMISTSTKTLASGGDGRSAALFGFDKEKDVAFRDDNASAADIGLEKTLALVGVTASAADFGLDKDLDFDRRDRERGTARLNQ